MFRTPLYGRYVSPVTDSPLTDKPDTEANGIFQASDRFGGEALSSSDVATVKLQDKLAFFEASILPRVHRATLAASSYKIVPMLT